MFCRDSSRSKQMGRKRNARQDPTKSSETTHAQKRPAKTVYRFSFASGETPETIATRNPTDSLLPARGVTPRPNVFETVVAPGRRTQSLPLHETSGNGRELLCNELPRDKLPRSIGSELLRPTRGPVF